MGLYIFMFITTTFSGTKLVLYSGQNKWAVHPIDVLSSNARSTSDQWLEQAAASRSLEEAVVEYQSRYRIPPPPHFDKWYDFAISRGSLIVDDFGQIHNDLLPFWGIKPIKIRQMRNTCLKDPGPMLLDYGSRTEPLVLDHMWSQLIVGCWNAQLK